MTGAARPDAVARYARRGWWSVALVAPVVLAIFVFADLPASRPERLDPRKEVRVRGVAVRDPDESGAVRVRYFHPVTEQRVTAEVYVWDRSLVPRRGDSVQLIARRADPLSVTAEGDAMPLATNLVVYAVALVAALLAAAGRAASVRRVERLAGAELPTFSMLGAMTPARRRTRCDLHLYPVTAVAGDPPVCSVQVLTTGRAPVGGRVVPVEVKGEPRPFGRVVARVAGGGVVWPAGRARRTARHPRPAGGIAAAVALPPAGPPPVTSGGAFAKAAVGHVVVAATSIAMLAAVAGVTARNSAETRRALRGAVPVVGEVVGHADLDSVVVLRYERDGIERTAMAPADVAGDYRKGVRYPMRVSRADPSRARLLAEPYDTTEPVVWGALPAAVALAVLGARWLSWRRNERVASDGPWWSAELVPGDSGWVVVAPDGAATCGVDAAGGDGRALDDDGAALPLVTVAATVAGRVEPGAAIAVWTGDTRLPVSAPATNRVRRISPVAPPAAEGTPAGAP